MPDRPKGPMEWRRLDRRANEYALGELEKGKTLARECARIVVSCQAWAYVARDLPDERVYDFCTAAISPWLERAEALPTQVLWRFLRDEHVGSVPAIVFEDPYARPTDSSITEGRYHTPAVFLADEVYQVIGEQCVGDASHLPVGEYPIVGVASSFPEGVGLPRDRSRVDRAVIVALARSSRAILIGAWDAESYLLFDRDLMPLVASSR